MFGMGMPEIILILAIALIVLGPKKLPEIAKSLGRGIAEFKKATTDFKQSINEDNDFKQAKQTLNDMKSDLGEAVHTSTRPDATTGMGDDDDDDDDDGEDLKTARPGQTAQKPERPSEAADTVLDETPQKAEAEDKEKGPSSNA